MKTTTVSARVYLRLVPLDHPLAASKRSVQTRVVV